MGGVEAGRGGGRRGGGWAGVAGRAEGRGRKMGCGGEAGASDSGAAGVLPALSL